MDLMDRRRMLMAAGGQIKPSYAYRILGPLPDSQQGYDTQFAPFTGEDTGFTFLLEFNLPNVVQKSNDPELNNSSSVFYVGLRDRYDMQAGLYIQDQAGVPYFICGWMQAGKYVYNDDCYLPGVNRVVWWHDAGTNFAECNINGLQSLKSKAANYYSSNENIIINKFSISNNYNLIIKDFICYKKSITAEQREEWLINGTIPD